MTSSQNIFEGDSIRAGTAISDRAFERLCKMAALTERDDEFRDVLTATESPRGRTVTVGRYTGSVYFEDGTILNILPGIKSRDSATADMSIRMLHTIFGLEYHFNAREENMNMFEFFVMVFIGEVRKLIRKGIKFSYKLVQANERVFKGKLLFADNIRENYIHKERVYVEYETFSSDRAENRLIKKTMEVLLKKSLNSRNRKDIKTLLLEMEDIPSSPSVAKDFDAVNLDRNMVSYVSPMIWCDIFLNSMNLGNTEKSGSSFAILTDTDALMSAYVAKRSCARRTDGSYSIGYTARIRNDECLNSTSVLLIDLKWNFYNLRKKAFEHDAELLYRTAPGYRVIPAASAVRGPAGGRPGGSAIRQMAASYLYDDTLQKGTA